MSEPCVSCGARDAWEDDTLCRSCREWTNHVWNQAIEQAALATTRLDGLGRTGNRMREMIRKLKREKKEIVP